MKSSLFVSSILILLSAVLYADNSKPLKRIYEMGGRELVDGSLEVTGAVQADRYYEIIGVSTPTVPNSKHARLWLNTVVKQFCVEFDNGSTTCLGSGGISGFAITAVDPLIWNSATGTMSIDQISLSTGVVGTLNIGTQSNLTASGAASLVGSNVGVGQISFSTGVVGTLATANFPALTGDVTTTAGSLATTATANQPNIKTFTSSITVTNPSGVSVTYQTSVGSFTGAGLTTCGDSTHALGWSSSNNLFTCQGVSGSSAGGIVSPGTFTWTNNFGITGSTLVFSTASLNQMSLISQTSGGSDDHTVIYASGSITFSTAPNSDSGPIVSNKQAGVGLRIATTEPNIAPYTLVFRSPTFTFETETDALSSPFALTMSSIGYVTIGNYLNPLSYIPFTVFNIAVGSQTFVSQGQGIVGSTWAVANQGIVGEVISKTGTGAKNFAASTHYLEIDTITVTAGNWLLYFNVRVVPATTETAMEVGIGTVSGDSATGLIDGQNAWSAQASSNLPFTIFNSSIPPYPVSPTTTTTYYLKYEGVYSAGTPQYNGYSFVAQRIY